jgi:repressor LexA
VTVKRIRKSRDKVELIAENPAFATRVVDLKREALAIEGVAVGIIRNGRTL